MKDLPNIDPSMLTPHTKSDRNLPIAGAAGFNPCGSRGSFEARAHKGIMTLDEIVAAERHVGVHPALGMGYGTAPAADRKHSHYFKPCPFAEVDVYRVLALFAVTDPCLQHAVKKLLVAGGRGAGKDISQDVKEAVDTLARWQEMRAEEVAS